MTAESSALEATKRLSQGLLSKTPSVRAQLDESELTIIHSKDVLVERRVDTNNIPHLMIHFKLQGRHGLTKCTLFIKCSNRI